MDVTRFYQENFNFDFVHVSEESGSELTWYYCTSVAEPVTEQDNTGTEPLKSDAGCTYSALYI